MMRIGNQLYQLYVGTTEPHYPGMPLACMLRFNTSSVEAES